MQNSSIRLIRLLVVIALFAAMLFHAVPGASAAPLLVDDFSPTATPLILQVTSANSPQFGTFGDTDPSILGGERDVEGIVIYGDGTMTVNTSNSSGFYSHSQPAFLAGRSIITWDGNDDNATALDPIGLKPLSLTADGNETFILGLVSNDLATQVEVRVYTTADNWSFLAVNIPAGGSQQAIPFVFTSFSQGGSAGPADFADVGAIQLIINSAATPTEDLDMVIDFFTVTTSAGYLDYGDAPDTPPNPSYGTLISSNGARHVLGNLILGSVSDGEADGQESPLANGDDNTGVPDDEDGVVRTGTPWADGTNGGHVQVTVAGASRACLSGWMDFGQDGNFTQATDRIFNGMPVVAGVNNLDFTIPQGTFPGGTGPDVILFARFRVVPDILANGACGSTGELPAYNGSRVNGEVEDYRWVFTPTAIELASLKAQPTTSPLVPVALIGVSAAVLLSVVFLTRRGRRKTA